MTNTPGNPTKTDGNPVHPDAGDERTTGELTSEETVSPADSGPDEDKGSPARSEDEDSAVDDVTRGR